MQRKIGLLLALLLFSSISFLQAQPGTWATGFGSESLDMAADVAVDGDGNAYVTGSFADTLVIQGDTLISLGESDIFVARFDSTGNLDWAYRMGWGSNEFTHGIELDGHGFLYVIGEFQDSTLLGTSGKLDTGYTWFAGGNFDLFILRMDTAGNYIRYSTTRGSGSEFIYGLTVDSEGSAIVTGKFRSNLTLGDTVLEQTGTVGAPVPGLEDIFLSRLDSSGRYRFAISAGGFQFDVAEDVAVMHDSVYVITGWFQDTCYFVDSTVFLVSQGLNDMFLAKYDSAGKFLWAQRAGGDGRDQPWSVMMDSSRNIYVAGTFDSTFQAGSFQISPTGGTAADLFLMKCGPDGTVKWLKNAGGSGYETAHQIKLSPEGDILMTGFYQGTAQFGNLSLMASGPNDQEVFVARYDSNGNALWVSGAGGVSLDGGQALDYDSRGYIYAFGTFTDQAWFGQTMLSSRGSEDFFLLRMTPEGSVHLDPQVQVGQQAKALVYPQPAGDQVRFRYEALHAGPAVIRVLDMSGKVLINKGLGFVNSGITEAEISLRSLPGGLYLYQLEQGSSVFRGKLLVRH